MGEYARSLALAQAAVRRWPGTVVHFLLSRAAPYAAATPFAHTLLPSSPTFHSAAVIECMRSFAPDIVIFDNAGRTAQLRAARAGGAGVVYISSRPRQRRKAFRWHWMRLIDQHWIAYPAFIAGAPRLLERLKLRALGRPQLRYLDVILAPPAAAPPAALLPLDGDMAAYVLVVPGGGTGHPRAADAVAKFFEAARSLAAGGVRTLFVGPVSADADRTLEGRLRVVARVGQDELGWLLGRARLVIVNGGSTLLQAIACGRACVAIPIAGDQQERIRRCAAAGVAVEAPLEAAAMTALATGLLADAGACTALAGRAAALGLQDGIDVALTGLADLGILSAWRRRSSTRS